MLTRCFSSSSRAHLLIVAIAGLLGALAVVAPVSAHFEGGHWGWSGAGSNLFISVRNNAGSFPLLAASANRAMTNWFNRPTPYAPFPSTGGASVTVDLVHDSGTDFWSATEIWANDCLFFCVLATLPVQSCVTPCDATWGYLDYFSAHISLNTFTMVERDRLNAQMTDKIITHELGHVAGLNHATFPDCTSVMRTGRLSFSTPTAHDVFDLNRRYPNVFFVRTPAC